ncbi:hypothetical protein FJNA_02350 [Thermus sp. FJN-A]
MNPQKASLRDLSREELLKRIQSPKPTPYRLLGEEEEVYVYCAFDALLYPLLTGKRWTVEARPPGGGFLRLTLTPNGPEEGGLWVSFIGPEAPLPEAPGMPASRCPYLHFFATWEELWAWRATLPPEVRALVQALPLSEAVRLAQVALEGLPEEGESAGCC